MCRSDCGLCPDCRDTDEWPAPTPTASKKAPHARAGAETTESPTPAPDRPSEALYVIPDPADPEWANVVHDTRTLDCMGGEHGACVLPRHCRCGCHVRTASTTDSVKRREGR